MSMAESSDPNKHTVLDVLKGTRAQLSKRKNWIKGHNATNAAKVEVDVDSPDASCFCLSGAVVRAEWNLNKEYGRLFLADDATALITKAIVGLHDPEYVGPYLHIPQWNDEPKRTHKEILGVIDKAIELAQAEKS